VPQPREAADYFGQHERCAVAILDVGGVDHGVNQVSVSVGQDVTLAAFDLLTGIIAPRPAAFCGFDALAVDHSGAGRSFTPCRFSADQQQRVIEREPQTIVAPQIEPASHR
jgi:hypothetical protein